MDFLFKQVATDNPLGFAIVMGIALLCGIIISVVYRLGTDRPSKYMMITAIIMPAVVQTVIMLVNGSVGAGVAVAGAFSLVRFVLFRVAHVTSVSSSLPWRQVSVRAWVISGTVLSSQLQFH